MDLLKNEPLIRDVILVAQGEMALEEFLKQVKETWQTYQLDMIDYQNKCKLIRGWDDLFNKVKENINQVAAMKLSPYFRVFEEEALTWEDRLNRISALFDVWIDVQRRWVYLEGIFTESAGLATSNSILFRLLFCEKLLICLEGKSMTPHQGNTFLFCSSQQLPHLHLGSSKGFLS